MDREFHIVGPILDSETGVRNYTIRLGDREVEFGVIPEPTREGISGWTMRVGSDRVVPGNFSTEPYASPEEAFEAGMRASKLLLEGPEAAG
ncbi:MAG: hypothetical protein M3Z66_12555 [Chloroflexota bacterium]|nr:hypothetical protein [Chloroflexota bacterium]